MSENSTAPRLVRLSKSIVGAAEAEAAARVILEDGYLGMGREVMLFEQELAGYLGLPESAVICVSTGTAALHLAVEASTDPGDEVLVPSLTFVASFQAIGAARAVPVACEVDPDSLTLDPEDAEKRITDKTRAVMPVHYASYPGDLDRVYRLAEKHGLRVIEDAAHAFGCNYQGRLIGSFGDVVCFSFDGIKNITSGEGGMIATRDEKTTARIRDARLLGVEKDTEQRYAGRRSWEFDVSRQGHRYHMSNIMAAVGRVQLRRLDEEFAPKRRKLAALYRENLADAPGIKLIQTDLNQVIPHIQPVLVGGGRRDSLRSFLESRGVQTGIHYKPNHLLTLFGGGRQALPLTEDLYERLLSLPLHPELETGDVTEICNLVREHLRELK